MGGQADHGGDHHHGPVPLPTRADQRRVLWAVLALNGLFMVVEVVGGVLTNSLALLADGIHMLSDVAGLGIALVAQSLLARPSSARHTFGLQRAEVLGAQANGVLLVGAAGWVAFEAVGRLGEDPEVEGAAVIVVASVGLLINVVSAVLLARVRGRSLNMRGAYLHMLSDAAGSIAAVGAGVAVVVADATWVDPVASLFIAALVLVAALGLLREATHVLLEGTPSGLDRAEVEGTIEAVDGVDEAHHLHLWSLASDVPALSAHVVISGDRSLHDAQAVGDRVRVALERDHDIAHATLELECHRCLDAG